MYVLTFSVFCLCTYLCCFVVILLFCVTLIFCCYSNFVVLCIFIFVCTSVGLLPPGESPIAVSDNSIIKTFRIIELGTVLCGLNKEARLIPYSL
jgi:hypothetical protein